MREAAISAHMPLMHRKIVNFRHAKLILIMGLLMSNIFDVKFSDFIVSEFILQWVIRNSFTLFFSE